MSSVFNTGPITGPSSRHQISPIDPAERIASLDVLRGFALLGILLANIQDFASTTGVLHDIPLDVVNGVGPHHALNVIVMTLQWLLVEGRMRSLFGLLLGAGSLLLLERIEIRRGAAVAADIFHRRYMWLMLIGFIHGVFIWYGDILFQYGMFSLLTLYPLTNVKPKRLIGIGLAISLLGGTLGVSNAMGMFGAMRSAALQEGPRPHWLMGRGSAVNSRRR
jgi:uncharacterized protein